MRKFKCRYCNSEDLFTENKGSHIGLYCGDCGKWNKWITKQEKTLFDRFLNKN